VVEGVAVETQTRGHKRRRMAQALVIRGGRLARTQGHAKITQCVGPSRQVASTGWHR
jgi:hypothetical protein